MVLKPDSGKTPGLAPPFWPSNLGYSMLFAVRLLKALVTFGMDISLSLLSEGILIVGLWINGTS